MVSVHSLTQDSRNALNRSRTRKNPFFILFVHFWTDLNGCRQRLLSARQLMPRKCSLCSQGKCLVDFRGRPFDFWGGYEWFQKKKISSRLISTGKKHANKFLGKIISCSEKKNRSWRIMLKKNLTPLYVGKFFFNSRVVWEKILTQAKSVKSPIPPSPRNVQWSCQPFRGWGKKRIWHLSKCHPSTKWMARVHHVVVFETKVLHFKIESTPIKDKWKEQVQKNAQLPFCGPTESFSLWNCLLRNSTLFSTRQIGALGLFWTTTKQGSEVSEDTWGTFCTLWSKKSTFLKGNFCI